MKTSRSAAYRIRNTLVLLLATGCWLPTAVLADNSLSFQTPEFVYGEPGTQIVVPVEVLLNPDSEVQGWSLSVAFDPGTSGFALTTATTFGTAAADVNDDPPGIRNIGYEKTELVDPTLNGQGEGAVSAVVLSFTMPITLGPAGSPHDILHLEVEGTVPPLGTTQTMNLDFVDGLQGTGQPVEKKLTVNGQTVTPSSSGISIKVIGRGVLVSNTNDVGADSLRQAISDAASGQTITFANTLDGKTILSEQILINKNLDIDASDLTGGITIDGDGRIFEITGNNTVVFDSLTLTNGVADFGGAISVNSTADLTVNNSTLSGNSALTDDGGGIFNDGTLTLNNSTLSGNSALTRDGGGIFNNGTLTLNNSTLSGNFAANDGGGIYNSGTANATNSIVAGNSGNNVFGELGGGSDNLTFGDPMLKPLGDYGGPTWTMPPWPGSAAIDAGLTSATDSLTDQRGLARVVGSAVDIGAVELQSFIVHNTNNSGEGSLRRAIIDSPSWGTITFSIFIDGQTIDLDTGQILINKNLEIDASDLTFGIIIDGNANGRIFEITGNNTVVFDSLTLTNGRADWGGAIYLNSGSATLTLNNSTLSGNSAYSWYGGGGIYNYGTLTLNNSTLTGNSTANGSGGGGGGIFNDGTVYNVGVLTLNNSTLSGNSAHSGGGIYDWAGTLTPNNSTLSDNFAEKDGGGIYTSSSLLRLNNTTLSGNSAGDEGGGIYNNSGTLTLNNSTFSDNSAEWGGGIDNYGPLTLNNSTLSDNSAVSGFGGIRSIGFTPNGNNSIVAGNTSSSGEPNISALITGSDNLISNDPLLAPLGDYGGPTQTMPPLPGSLAIDRGGATTLTSDQRGFDRVGAPDKGAAEFQGYSDPVLMDHSNLGRIWSLDTDGDGNAFGMEFALGTDWNHADADNFYTLSSGGVAFGFNPDATNSTAWILKRSLDLVSPFIEIYRFDGPTGVTSNTIPALITKGPTSITVQDQSGVTRAFYQFEAQISP